MHFRKTFGRTGKGSFTEKAKIVDRGSLSSTPERTGSELQYEPFLSSVACSKTELSIRENVGRSGKGSFAEKAKIVDRGSLYSALQRAGFKLQYEPYLFSVAFS